MCYAGIWISGGSEEHDQNTAAKNGSDRYFAEASYITCCTYSESVISSHERGKGKSVPVLN
jgi:hypothetical protein